MEQLKKELQEKGYTFFKMQDYPEFSDDYIEYKQYVCNAEKNLLHIIDSVRIDGHFLKNSKHALLGTDFHINERAASFNEIEEKIDNEYLPFVNTKENFSQYWFYSDNKNHNEIEHLIKLINKIVEKLYDENSDVLDHIPLLTYYKKDCFLREHQDGKTGTRLCAVLIYLNDEDYKMEWGGNIVFERTETIPPIYGNVAVLDFKEGNCFHEVKKVVDGYGRYAFLTFVSLLGETNTPNYY
jgi:Rps23 Pro-64 3,4-dihydroxylase Tpa1-like proline 4-hydroxylase